jgi:hypothetical protein
MVAGLGEAFSVGSLVLLESVRDCGGSPHSSLIAVHGYNTLSPALIWSRKTTNHEADAVLMATHSNEQLRASTNTDDLVAGGRLWSTISTCLIRHGAGPCLPMIQAITVCAIHP